MQSKLFVFVVSTGKDCVLTTKMIREKLNESNFPFEFLLKENLLSGRVEEMMLRFISPF